MPAGPLHEFAALRVIDGHFLEVSSPRDARVEAGQGREGHVAVEAAEEGGAARGRGGGERVVARVEQELHLGVVAVEPVGFAQDAVGEGGVSDEEGLLLAREEHAVVDAAVAEPVPVEVVLDLAFRPGGVFAGDFEELEGARSSASVFFEAATDEVDEDLRVWKPLVRPCLVEIQLVPLFCVVVVLRKPEELHHYAAEREYVRAWADYIVRGLIGIGTHVNVDLWGTIELGATGPIVSFEPTDGVGVCGDTVR